MPESKSGRPPIKVDLWKCEDLKAIIRREVQAHVKDVELAKKLEKALGDHVVYGDGGGGGHVGVA